MANSQGTKDSQSFKNRVFIPFVVITATIAFLFVVGLKLMNVGSGSSNVSAAPSDSTSVNESAAPKSDQLPVVVLNGASIAGLAKKTGDALAEKGWTIKSVGNWQGKAYETNTIFYPPSGEADAQKLASETGAEIAPAETLMDGQALTFVLMK